ncbi:MAG: restriction endonuclease subunit S, partial [Intrasporangiaceae bacterium]|nr:restriction endonuclease subunit S [Intrasporangiaceae bacterium]
AGTLDQADAIRAKRRQVLAHLDSLTQSIFHDMFGRDEATAEFGDVAEIQGGLQVSAKRAALPVEVPYLRVANAHRGRLDLAEVKTLRATEAEVDRTRLRKYDLLFVEGHANPLEVGRVAMWDGSVAGCVHQNHLIRGRIDKQRLLPVVALHWFNSVAGADHFRRAGRTTSGLNTISASTVRSAPIVLPDRGLQTQFADRVRQIEGTKSRLHAAVAADGELFASLQSRAFRGEL